MSEKNGERRGKELRATGGAPLTEHKIPKSKRKRRGKKYESERELIEVGHIQMEREKSKSETGRIGGAYDK